MAKAHSRMPVVFFGHGSPMNTLERNKYTETWQKLGESIPRPNAILCVSAHWYTEGTAVTAMEKPKTIHDFYGFPQALFDVQYPAPGDPRLAARVRELLEPVEVRLDDSWGLDHGTWSVLKHAYPDAKIPVVQLSIDGTRAPDFHYETGKRLAPLRDEGVLVAGSGNVVHNLRLMKRVGGPAFDWAVRFNERVREALANRTRAEQALRASESRLKAILHSALDAHVAMDETGRVTTWNQQAESLFGWAEREGGK